MNDSRKGWNCQETENTKTAGRVLLPRPELLFDRISPLPQLIRETFNVFSETQKESWPPVKQVVVILRKNKLPFMDEIVLKH